MTEKGKSKLSIIEEKSKRTLENFKMYNKRYEKYDTEKISNLNCNVHMVHLCLTDDTTGCKSHGRNLVVITKKCGRVKKLVNDIILDVLNENGGYFDNFIPNPEWINNQNYEKYIPTERSIKMAREIRDRVLKHNDEILGIS